MPIDLKPCYNISSRTDYKGNMSHCFDSVTVFNMLMDYINIFFIYSLYFGGSEP